MKLIYGLDFTFSNYRESSDERKALKHYLNVAKSIRAKNVKNLNNDILLKIENLILNQKVSELQRLKVLPQFPCKQVKCLWPLIRQAILEKLN